MPTQEELNMLLSLPLDVKELKSKQRIRDWYNEHLGKVYVSFSGGKDSTVLLNLVREEFPDVVGVFSDTGLEYPEIKEFIATIPNIITIRPKLTFLQVIEKYGIPVISKEVSQYIEQFRKYPKLRDKRWNGEGENKVGKIPECWKPMVDSPFLISNQCCDVLKKRPFKKFEKETGLMPFVGTMAYESRQRKQSWLKHGCNAYESKRPISTPLSFWTEEDIWNYIKQHNIPYSKIYDMGYERTGCMYCLYGLQKEGENNRLTRMKITHPKIYDYVINKLKFGEIIDYMNKYTKTNIKY